MTEFYQVDVNTNNNESLRTLARAIALSQGQFSLILACCNYVKLRQRLMQQLRESCPIEFREYVLVPSTKTLYTTIHEELGSNPPPALIIFGLELVRDLDALLIATNQARDEFRKHFPFPLVLWVTDEVLHKLIRVAPDFTSWAATPIEMESGTDELIHFIQETTDEVFAKVLNAGAGRFLDKAALNLGIGSPLRAELESARKELQNRGVRLDQELEASLEFVLGRAADDSIEQSRQHYERSLALWQHRPNLERQGCVLYSLSLWWRTYAERHRAEHEQACIRAKDYRKQCIEVFEQANRPDLIAKFINALGEVLQRLQQWDELEAVAQKALALHQTYSDPFRLARAYGFLADVALAKSAWSKAKQLAQKALLILASVQPAASTSISDEMSADLEWEHSFHKGWYLLSLARAQQGLENVYDALKVLETARAETKPQYDPELYIRILEELRNGYFKQGEYLTAFRFKQEQRAIEHQYDFRAFIGAGRLLPKQQVTNPALPYVETQETGVQEIAVSGRQQDVNRLVERLSRHDHKLIVIYGQSGVGKSSILQAGLIPALKHQTIATRDVLPVLQQVYTNWVQGLERCLAEALEEVKSCPIYSPSLGFEGRENKTERKITNGYSHDLDIQSVSLNTILNLTTSILEKLRINADENRLTILIFDQFEEFLFVYKEPKQRKVFYDFLRDCLNIPYIKVILSLREDYLHYLLQCNRLTNLEVINNNILDKNILYYLGNFSPEDAKSVIQSLTERSQFYLEPALIDKLVQDLAGELGEVRPIELQVVGAQLQAENITTLEAYQKRGPKEELVKRYLEAVVQDCGPENQRTAQLILYLLTDEQGTRPLKTRFELAEDLELEANQLDLVLKVLVDTGLVFELPEAPADHYQLVHDYLVPFIRQGEEPELLAELKLTKEQLKQALHKEQEERKRAEIAEIEALSSLSQALLLSHDQLGALVASVKAGRKLLQTEAPTETKQRTVDRLRQAVYDVQERNRLEGHEAAVFDVRFSPDGQTLASGSEDGMIKLWGIDGKELVTYRGHQDSVFSISFSPDGQTLASASADKTVKLWGRDGTLSKTLNGHHGRVFSVSFSPDGQTLASASEDGTIKLWRSDGTWHKIIKRPGACILCVSFSPDGQLLAAASADKTIKLWSLDGTLLRTFKGHSAGIFSVRFSPDGQVLASASADGTVKLWSIDGKELNTLQTHGFRVFRISFSPDGQMLALASADRAVRLYSLDGAELQTFQRHNGKVFSVHFSPDGQMLASASEDKTLRLWSLEGIGMHTSQGHNGRVLSVSLSPHSQLLASASEDKTLKLWSLDGTLLKTFQGHDASVRSVSFSPNGELLASASADATVKLWRLNGTLLKTFQGHNASVRSVSFSPDGQFLASASNDITVKLWNLNGTLLKIFQGHSASILSISFSPDGQILASASEDKTVKLWKLDGTLIKTLQGHELRVLSVSFSPDGQILASASADRTIKLWSRDGKLLKTFQGHEATVRGVSFNADTQIIASASADRTVKLWSREGNVIRTLKGHLTGVCHASFSADGQVLVSVGEDSTVKLWNVDGTELQTFQGPVIRNRGKVDFCLDDAIASSASGRTVSELESLLIQGCHWMGDYLKTNPNVRKSDRYLCDNIGTLK
jgi:WD40 repeat protein